MKVSIITAVYNGAKTIEYCIKSVINQSYENIEYIIIDGNSVDETVDIIKKYHNPISQWISEPDEGIYDALNKGIKISTGDIVGFLHADDIYADNEIINKIVNIFQRYDVDSCHGDLVYVDKNNINKIIRYWKSSPYHDRNFKLGWMPPHPTFFVKKEIYDTYGLFNSNLQISADYELMLRLFERYNISNHYVPEVFIKMRVGGASNKNLRNLFRKSYEDYKAWKINGLDGGFLPVILKNVTKLNQFFLK